MNRYEVVQRRILLAVSLVLVCAFAATSSAQIVPGIKVPDGFEVVQAAGDQLATDIYCLAVSPRGETFVSGPGYIKVLSDSNGDGQFDAVRTFSDFPKSGAQGICFDGDDVLCTGDGGLWKFSDINPDGVAGAPPQKLLSIKTGSEHDAHAIRKGPDGWWYLLAGNGTPILKEYFSGANSPVTQPRAGFLMRFSPDLSQREIFAHGFRNAYDFDFNSQGQVFVYDSDGERDISLPWYRPTRVFQMRAGDDAGWVAAGWKRPSDFFDMPKEIGALGRGSPTGVVVGNSKSFPAEYADAIFVADWTFGRVVVFKKNPKTGAYDRGSEFAVADGQFGFAVTDLDFAADGSLLVSTGGRGTQGAVYRVRFLSPTNRQPAPAKVALDGGLNRRVVDAETLLERLKSSDPNRSLDVLSTLVGRRDILSVRSARSDESNALLVNGLTNWLVQARPESLSLLMRVLGDLDSETLLAIDRTQLPVGSRLLVESIHASGSVDSLQHVARALAKGNGDPLLIARIGQLWLGGCGREGADQMFQGYTATRPVEIAEPNRVAIADQLAVAMKVATQRSGNPSPEDRGLQEIGRLAAMLGVDSPNLLRELATQLKHAEATAQADIHWLNCLAQVLSDSDVSSDPEFESLMANGLVGINAKLKRDQQEIDRNFYPRMKSLTRRLLEKSSVEFALMVGNRLAGEDGDLFLLESMEGVGRDAAVAQFVRQVESNSDSVTAGQLGAIALSPGEIYLPLLRSFSGRKEFQDVLIASLHRSPVPEDRELFVSGLKASNPRTVKQAAMGLRRIFDQARSVEAVWAYVALRRLPWDKPSVSIRDQLILLLRRHSGKQFGYQQKSASNQQVVIDRWGEFIQASYPQAFASLVDTSTVEELEQRIASIDWSLGDAVRGRKIYVDLKCAQCHDAGTRLGPRLEGLATRFSRADVFRAIASPSDQVPDRYRAIVIETVDGQFFQGSMVYESVDGITLQEVGGNTVRINRADIEARSVSRKSLMPEGLLNEASDQDWADLSAYLAAEKR